MFCAFTKWMACDKVMASGEMTVTVEKLQETPNRGPWANVRLVKVPKSKEI